MKIRPKLPKGLESRYKKLYLANRKRENFTSKLSKFSESWMHHQCANNPLNIKSKKILEIGAGTLNHLSYEQSFDAYDVVEPNKFFYQDSSSVSLVNNFYDSIFDIPAHNKYDKIISIATLEHIENLEETIAYAKKLLKKDGYLLTAIPSEGGFLWGLAWRLTTGIQFRLTTGYSYKHVLQHEHINDMYEIKESISKYFKIKTIKRLGFSNHFSLYTYIIAQIK